MIFDFCFIKSIFRKNINASELNILPFVVFDFCASSISIENANSLKNSLPKSKPPTPGLHRYPLSAIPPTKSPKNCDFPASLPLFSLSMQEVKNGFFPTENFKLCYYIYAHKNNNNKYPKNVSILLWLNNHEH